MPFCEAASCMIYTSIYLYVTSSVKLHSQGCISFRRKVGAKKTIVGKIKTIKI